MMEKPGNKKHSARPKKINEKTLSKYLSKEEIQKIKETNNQVPNFYSYEEIERYAKRSKKQVVEVELVNSIMFRYYLTIG